ncbi:MAG: Tat pathway signal protein [Gammaproteobacteria bacterium]|nr:Tat pathway signal protein [Gammaproteobacteria bacterium]
MKLRALLSIAAGAALLCAAAGAFAAPAGVAPAVTAAPATAPPATAPGPIATAEPSGALREPQAVLFDPFLSELEERTFRYFWDTANPANGLIPDRYPTPSFASIAAVGFGLTAYPIGVERHYITRAEARDRVLATLRFFMRAPNQHGFFYHFLDMKSGARANDSEVSTVDTALLLAGMLFCQSYFDTQHPREVQIRKLVDEIYRRVDWTWAQPRPPVVALAWTPESGFSGIDWQGYNEAMLVYLLALGSPTHAISPQAWDTWTSTYDKHWGTLYDQTYLSFGPLFGHQYTHVWVDFRGIRDAYMRAHGLDYFENSRRATYTQRRYAIANPKHWQAYGKNVWGISASDGPGGTERYEGQDASFMRYAARGVGIGRIVDDGTIAPTAAISSLPFAPEIVLPATLEMYHRYGSSIYSVYGFLDAFNASFNSKPDAAGQSHTHVPDSTVQRPDKNGNPGWVDQDYIGIDEGPILAMIENYRSDLVWRVMRNDPYLRTGLERAGFSGGWLAPGQ